MSKNDGGPGEYELIRWGKGWSVIEWQEDERYANIAFCSNRDTAEEIRDALAAREPASEEGLPDAEQVMRGGGSTVRVDFVEGGEPTSEDAGGWWCPTCRVPVDGRQVTFEERHKACGTPVGATPTSEDADFAIARAEVLKLDIELAACSATSAALRDDLDAAREENKRLRAGIEEEIRYYEGSSYEIVPSRLRALLDGGGE